MAPTFNWYPPNTTIQLTATISNALLATPVNPTTVLFFVSGPDGTFGQYTGTQSASGSYFCNYLTATPGGKWHYWAQGIGTVNVQSVYQQFGVDVQKF